MILSESEVVELKKSTSELKEAVIAIVSMLNKHQQCELYFGVKNDGRVVGQDISEKTIRDISKAIADNIEPKLYPAIHRVELGGKPCVKIQCKGRDVPYFAYGRAYIRVGDENRQLSAKELEHIIIRKNKDKVRWDTEACPSAECGDISAQKLKLFLKDAGLEHGSIVNSLKKLSLLKEGKPTNAAVILFGKHPEKFFPNAQLRCAVFGTTDTTVIIDRQEYTGDLFFLIEKAEEYILKNIHIGMKVEGLARVDIPEIDREAFREAVINAFCHRDYFEYGSVDVAIFKDRVEIRNPGLLYGGLTIEQIMKEKVSERRNEVIASMFHRVHYVEKWGRGISLILAREPKTEFKELGTHFIVGFKRATPQTTLKTTPKTDEAILVLVKQNARITKEDLAKQLRLTLDGVKYHIKKLRKDNILKWIGPSKSGHWEVIG